MTRPNYSALRAQIVASSQTPLATDMDKARASAALYWLDRDGAISCGRRDAEVIFSGGADMSADVQSALSAIRVMRGDFELRKASADTRKGGAA
jgi:hypothetical protein